MGTHAIKKRNSAACETAIFLCLVYFDERAFLFNNVSCVPAYRCIVDQFCPKRCGNLTQPNSTNAKDTRSRAKGDLYQGCFTQGR